MESRSGCKRWEVMSRLVVDMYMTTKNGLDWDGLAIRTRIHHGHGYKYGTGQQVGLTNFLALHFDSDDL